MELEFIITKELDNSENHGILLKAKRKREANEALASNAALSMGNLSTRRVSKRRRMDGLNVECERCSRINKKSIARSYSNFVKSGVPQRVMFYQDGEWSDFPESLITSIRKDLLMKRAAIEVELNGYSYLLDFLHMSCLNMEKGSRQPIAWIDEADCVFFPEIFDGNCCHQQNGKYDDNLDNSHELKVQLEIDIIGADMKECVGESNPHEYHLPNVQNQQEETNAGPVVKHLEEELDPEFMRRMLTSFGSVDIVDLRRCSNSSAHLQFEIFQKQVEITEKRHGDANVRFAWLAVSSLQLSSILSYGSGWIGSLATNSAIGIGVHLTSVNCPNLSARDCDVDENGVRHMAFCRVIVGSMERIRGSGQCIPSSMEFDTAVDDPENPTLYLVWSMNANTHIYPEYVISFKVPPDAEGNLTRKANVAPLEGPAQQPNADQATVNQAINNEPELDNAGRALTVGSSAPRVPRSPWMPFPMLIDAVSPHISAHDRDLINAEYNLFKAKTISRDEFIRRLRAIVGDRLLKSIITNHLQLQIPSEAQAMQQRR